MSNGADRYHVKAIAGWSRTREDGSAYDPATDEVAADAESWFAQRYDGVVDDSIALRGDSGYDVVVARGGRQLRIDVVHAGRLATGDPRPGRASCLIVNVDSNKLIGSDLLVLVEGPPFVVVGGIYTARFLAIAEVRDHGYGPKLSLRADHLFTIDALLRKRSRS